MNRLKDEIFTYVFVAIVFGGIGYLIFRNSGTSNEVSKNETNCAQFIYYNPTTKQIDTSYSPITIYEDSIVNIQAPLGGLFRAKDFLTTDDVEVDDIWGYDITLINGTRYRVFPLDNGKCFSKSKMDSIRNNHIPHEEIEPEDPR